jgi:hypothetical protein
MEETNGGIKIPAVTDCVFCKVRAESLETVDRLIITERDVLSYWNSGRITGRATERARYKCGVCIHFLTCFSYLSFAFRWFLFWYHLKISWIFRTSKRVMHDVVLEFISLDLSTSAVWHKPHVLNPLSVCCGDACLHGPVAVTQKALICVKC